MTLPLHALRALVDAVPDSDASDAIRTDIELDVDATDLLKKVLTFGYQGKCGSKLKQAVDQFIIKKKTTLPKGINGICEHVEIQQLQAIYKIVNEALQKCLHELPTNGVVETTNEVQPQQKSVDNANDAAEATYGVQHPDISVGDVPNGAVETRHQDHPQNVCVDQVPLPQDAHDMVLEKSSNTDMSPDEVKLLKMAVLSSRNVVNNDFLATEPKTDNYCVKCDEEGPLLICSGSSCQLAVHESCLPSSSSLEDDGSFYCPFCSYTQALAAFEKAKEKYSLTWKAQIAFGVRHPLHQKKQKQSTAEVPSKPVEERNMGNTDCSPTCNESSVLNRVAETSPSTTKDAHDRQKDAHGIRISDAQSPCLQNIDKADPVGEQNVEMSSSKKHIKCRRPAKRYANLLFPYARRTKLRWTAEEEDALLEEVNRYPRSDGENIPWTKILETGGNIFHKTRTPVDLKDKWRNIIRKHSKTEQGGT